MGFKRPLVRIQSLGPRNPQSFETQGVAGFFLSFRPLLITRITRLISQKILRNQE